MSTFSRIFTFICIILVVAACDNQQDAELMPTLAILPSATSTDTPTITPTFTETPTETPTLTRTPTRTPTNTLSPTSTVSLTPSQTFTPTVSATSTLTLTFTQTPTFTATATPLATATPTLTFTPTLPIISFFQSNVTTAAPGAQVTLRWSASADTVEIRQLQPGTATILQSFVVAPIGSQVVTLPTTGNVALYRLVAMRGGQQTTTDLNITFTCVNTWFFAVTAPGGDCPNGPSVSVVGSYQPFERGVMFMFTNQNAQQRVCGLQNQDNRYVCYANGWDGSTEVPYSPPSGLDEPDDMFNWAFANTTSASGNSWENQIGWATSGSPNNNPVTVQYDTKGRLYIRLPNGTYFLDGDANFGAWSKIE